MRYTYIKRKDGSDFVFPENGKTLRQVKNLFEVKECFSFPAEKIDDPDDEAGCALMRARILLKYKNLFDAIDWVPGLDDANVKNDLEKPSNEIEFEPESTIEEFSVIENPRLNQIRNIVKSLIEYHGKDYRLAMDAISKKYGESKSNISKLNRGYVWQIVRDEFDIKPKEIILEPINRNDKSNAAIVRRAIREMIENQNHSFDYVVRPLIIKMRRSREWFLKLNNGRIHKKIRKEFGLSDGQMIITKGLIPGNFMPRNSSGQFVKKKDVA